MRTPKSLLLSLLLSIFAIAAQAQIQAGFIFTNERVVGSHPNMQLIFEIHMNADQAGSYHTGGNIYLNYNPAAFGTSINANGKITCNRLTLLNGGPHYNVTDGDTGPSILGLGWLNLSFAFFGQTPTTAPADFDEIPLTYTPLVEITIDIADPTQPFNIAFSQTIPSPISYTFIAGGNNSYVSPNLFGPPLTQTGNQLPVEWLSFTANRLDSRNVQLLWETANETNNDLFVVQRSIDAQIFEDIGTVNAIGNSSTPQAYEFLDNGYQANINYYRIKQVDNDGASSFSNIAEIRLDGKLDVLFNVYPSPAKEFVEIKVLGPLGKGFELSIFDMQGRLVHFQDLSASTSVTRIEVSEFTKGLYNYEIKKGLNIKKTGRFLKI